MAIKVPKFPNYPINFPQFLLHFPPFRSFSSLQQTIKNAIESKSYQQLPNLIISSKDQPFPKSNPFSFLSDLNLAQRTQIIDEILQSLIPYKPRQSLKPLYSHLLTYALQSSNPLPISFAVLQRTIRSGFSPLPQTHLMLSSAWLEKRRKCESVASILLEMESIGYNPDLGTCNYILSSLCAVDQLAEAVKVLKGIAKAGCVPDLSAYSTVINSLCRIRKTADAIEMMQEMVVKMGINPRQGTVVKLAAALRANREIWKAVEVIEFLEKEGCNVGFESYELVLEGCLECKEYVLAGKVAAKMADKGFIPYIKARQKVVEGLAEAGEWDLACIVRDKFARLSS